MKELSREEEIERLEQLIARKDDEFDKEQGKRVKRTFFVICGAIYAMLLHLALENGINISDIDVEGVFFVLISLTVGVAFAAGLIMFVAFGVIYYIMNGAMKRAETIAKLKGELYAIKFSKYNKE